MFQLKSESKISKMEWFFVLGVTIILDIIQLALVPFAVNPVIDVAVGIALIIYFPIRGVQLDINRVISLCVGFFGEEITDGIAPTWTADIIYIWWNVRVKEREAKAQMAVKMAEEQTLMEAQRQESERLLEEQENSQG
jgi:hypothetical protein